MQESRYSGYATGPAWNLATGALDVLRSVTAFTRARKGCNGTRVKAVTERPATGRSGRARAELGSSIRKLGLPTCGAASPTIRQRGFTNSCVALAIAREGSRCGVSAFADPRCSGI
jgi:hypothetical protein